MNSISSRIALFVTAAVALSSIALAATPPAAAARPRVAPEIQAEVRVIRPVNKDLPQGKPHFKLLDDRVINEVRELFRAYELRNIVSFRQIVGVNMRTTDDYKFGTSGRQMGYSVNCDFTNLRSIEFDIEVQPPVYNPTETIARVTVNWSRRAQFNSSGEDWIVRDQRSILVFDMTSPRPKLITIEQAPLFGLCNQLQVMVIDRGDIVKNGVETPVVGPMAVRNGRLGAGTNQIFSFGNFRRFRRTPAGGAAPAAPVVTATLRVLNTFSVSKTTPGAVGGTDIFFGGFANGFTGVPVQIQNTGTSTQTVSVVASLLDATTMAPATTQTYTLNATVPPGATVATVPNGQSFDTISPGNYVISIQGPGVTGVQVPVTAP